MDPKHAATRFWRFVDKSGECWEWRGSTLRNNSYGQFWFDGRNVVAHRFSWLLHVGDIPPRLIVCHRCDNRHCVRPEHLFLGTYRDNTIDAMGKGRLRRPPSVNPGIKALARAHGRTHQLVSYRLLNGWSLEEALSTPPGGSRPSTCRHTVVQTVGGEKP